MQKKNKLFWLMLVAFLCCSINQVVYALTPSEDADNSLTVEFAYNGMVYEDVEVSVYYVASWEEDEFVLTDTFAASDIVLETTTTPSASEWREIGEILEAYIHDMSCDCEECQHTNTEGISVFENLENGVYYVEFADVYCEGGILVSDPVVITLPTYEGTTNTWDYEPIVDLKVALIDVPDEPDDSDEDPDRKRSKSKATDVPDEPDTPEVTNTPEKSDAPATPQSPDTPDTPEDTAKIPQTGSWNWLVTPLALTGVLLFLFGFLGMITGRKKDE